MESDKFPRPELLSHPNIPKPLHGVAPRVVMGRQWWDQKRQVAYAQHNYHCWACGVHKSKAVYHKWLEAHEGYKIDYSKGIVELEEIVALCHSCHNFIHSGRLWILYQKGEILKERALNILEHGLLLLEDAQIQPFYVAVKVYSLLLGLSDDTAERNSRDFGWHPPNYIAPWCQWHMIIEGKKYYSPYKDEEDWYRHFNQ